MTRLSVVTSVLVLLQHPLGLVHACVIQGQDAGMCMPPQDIQDRMPFCAQSVQYTACVPRDLPWYGNLTIEKKDKWLESTYAVFLNERLAIEADEYKPDDPTLYNYYFESVVRRFTNDEDCQAAYRNYLCYMNFPRCNGAEESLSLCLSVCENFFQACAYPKYMWRCYDPVYQGGRTQEGTNGEEFYDSNGNPVMLRAMFPGLPFVENAFVGGAPIDVCTPALANGAVSVTGMGYASLTLLTLATALHLR